MRPTIAMPPISYGLTGPPSACRGWPRAAPPPLRAKPAAIAYDLPRIRIVRLTITGRTNSELPKRTICGAGFWPRYRGCRATGLTGAERSHVEGRSPVIAVVEDNAGMLRSIARLLAMEG